MANKMSEVSGPNRRHDSWKAIAHYFGRSTRTVQRWHTEYALPVYSLGGPKSPVFAFSEELDGWMRERGRSLQHPPIESDRPLLAIPDAASNPLTNPPIEFDSELISSQARQESDQLVAIASRMWDSLSFRNLTLIVEHYRKAADLNPSNAIAYAGLSLGLIAQGTWGMIRTQAAYGAAEAALSAAFAIDSNCRLAMCARAWLNLVSKRDWIAARESFDEIMRTAPDCTRALNGRGLLLVAEGRTDQASQLFTRAAAQSPLSSASHALLSWCEYLAGNLELSLDHISEMRSSGRPGPICAAVEGLISILQSGREGQLERLQTLLAEFPHQDVLHGAYGYACARNGNVHRAREVVSAIRSRGGNGLGREPYGLALGLIGLNEHRTAVQALEHSYNEGSLWSLGFHVDPILDPLRGDQDFRSFLSKASYPNFAGSEPFLKQAL